MAVITKWRYYRGGREAGFHRNSILYETIVYPQVDGKRKTSHVQDQIIISIIFNLRDGFFDSTIYNDFNDFFDFNPQLRLQIFKTLL